VHPAPCTQPSEKVPLIYRSTLVGMGNAVVYDTYLSPLKYTGANFGIIEEQLKMTGWGKGNISAQHLFTLEIAETKNPMKTATGYAGSLEYGYGLHYRFKPVHKIQFFAGMQADALLGFIYNTRNSNNPVTGKANLNLNVSGMAAYKFRIKKQDFLLRWQVNVPVAGGLFSPEFGQSYYEIGEGDTHNLIHFASLHNQWTMRNLFSVELPFTFCALRLAYMNWIYETRVNDLDTHISSNSFYIGVSRNFFIVPNRKINKNNYKCVFE
jgi:hypothetical protein